MVDLIKLLFSLAKRQIMVRYRASYLGISWALIEPIILMLILNFVFGVGIKGGRSVGVPYVAYLITGLAANSFFSEGLNSTVMSVRNNTYLLRKVNFHLELIPASQVFASLLIHFTLLVAVFIILMMKGIYPQFQWFELLYYVLALSVFLLGAGFLTSSIAVYVLDFRYLVQIITRFLFYLTPIFWSIERFPKDRHWVLKMNPMYYIITGYRSSLFGFEHLWERGWIGAYYWGFTLFLFIIGLAVFRKLKSNFLDVL